MVGLGLVVPAAPHGRPDRPPPNPPPPRSHHLDHRHPLHRGQHGDQPGNEHPRQCSRHPHLAGQDVPGRFLHPPDEPGHGLGTIGQDARIAHRRPSRHRRSDERRRLLADSGLDSLADRPGEQAGRHRLRPRFYRQGHSAPGHSSAGDPEQVHAASGPGRSGAGHGLGASRSARRSARRSPWKPATAQTTPRRRHRHGLRSSAATWFTWKGTRPDAS